MGSPCEQELYEEEGNLQVLVTTFWRLPLIFVAMIAVRFACIAAFNPLFRLAKSGTRCRRGTRQEPTTGRASPSSGVGKPCLDGAQAGWAVPALN